jgi:16S rRNA (guanine527-N7)-methyltransferase
MDASGGTPAALDQLALRYGLSVAQQEQLAALLTVMAADEHAPTAVCAPVQAIDVHLADSLSALVLHGIGAAERVADIGSGAGFPGLALAVALPAAEVRLLESNRRACEYLERAGARAKIANARVVRARAEEWHEGLRAHDLALARAVAPQPVVLEYAAPLLGVGGRLVDWRGRRDLREEAGSLTAAHRLGLERVEIRGVSPFSGARDHHLHLYLKVRETPSSFPRRTGMARKRPLSR